MLRCRAELRGFTQVDRELLLHGIRRRVAMVISRLWSMPAIVAETDLLGVSTRPFAAHVARHFPIDIHEFPVPIPDQHLYMMWNTKLDADPVHKRLREYLMATTRQRICTPDVTTTINVPSLGTRHGRKPARTTGPA